MDPWHEQQRSLLWEPIADLLRAFVGDIAPRQDQDARWLVHDVAERLEETPMGIYEGKVTASEIETAQRQFAVAFVDGLVAMCPPDWRAATSRCGDVLVIEAVRHFGVCPITSPRRPGLNRVSSPARPSI